MTHFNACAVLGKDPPPVTEGTMAFQTAEAYTRHRNILVYIHRVCQGKSSRTWKIFRGGSRRMYIHSPQRIGTSRYPRSAR